VRLFVAALSNRATLVLGVVTAFLVVAGVAHVTPALAATDHVTECPPFLTGSLPDVIANAASGDTIVFDQDCTDGNAILLSGSEIAIGGPGSPTTLTIDATGHDVLSVRVENSRGIFARKILSNGFDLAVRNCNIGGVRIAGSDYGPVLYDDVEGHGNSKLSACSYPLPAKTKSPFRGHCSR
jgi:hypothetical protein